MNILDDARSFPSLWAATRDFVESHPYYLHSNADLSWLIDEETGEYNNCQFFSNFEIGDLNFFRSEQNEAYFDWLDRSGGFYYERFGDAPIHTLSLAMFAPPSAVWFFRDIGYQHEINRHCPIRSADRCACQPTDLDENFYKLVPLESPQMKPKDTCIRQWLAAAKLTTTFVETCQDQQQKNGWLTESEKARKHIKSMDWVKKKPGWNQQAERAFGGDGYGGYAVDGMTQ